MASEILQRSRQEMVAHLAEGSLRAVRPLGSTLRSLSTYYGILGTILCVDDDPAAWNNIHLSCQYHFWTVRFKDLAYKKVPHSGSLNSSHVACCLCYALACDLDDWIEVLKTLLIEAEESSNIVDQKLWQKRCFEPFVLQLSKIALDQAPPIPDTSRYGIYSDLFVHWQHEALFAGALRQVCEYHCKHMSDTKDREAEFSQPPFNLMPWELLAISKVRQDLRLTTPQFEHPLMNIRNLKMIDPNTIQDDFLARIEQLFERLQKL